MTELGTGPLAGIRVIDLTRVFSGPFATQILADLGADVVKVERIDGGDEARTYGILSESEVVGSAFLAMNRNKRSIAIDVRAGEGRAVIKRLIKDADVIVDNFRPGVMQRLRLDYDSVAKLNPRIISCSISGFGSQGHLRSRAANDLQMQAFSGLLSMTGEPGGNPVRTPAPLGDLSAGLFAAIGILAALVDRERTAQGQKVETSMLEAILNLLNHFYTDFWLRGRVQPKMGTANALGMPNQAFPTSDGWVAISAANEDAFRRMCEALGAPDLADDARFSSLAARYAHRAELANLISGLTASVTSEVLVSLLDKAGVSCSPLRTLDETASDSLLEELDAVVTMTVQGVGQVRMVALPLHFSRSDRSCRRPPPRLGEHTAEVLREAGYDDQEITALEQGGIVSSVARWHS